MAQSNITPPVQRTQLIELLDRLSGKRLIYAHAPAGFGKTLSVRMWLEHRGGASAWVAVSEIMASRPAVFFRRCADALLSLQPESEALRQILGHESFDAAPFEFMERALLAFYAAAQGSKRTCTFVIDDLHLLENPNILRFLSEHAPSPQENITLCLISRTAPPDSFSGHVVKDSMGIVDVESLIFSEEEIKSLFASRGRSLTQKQAREVRESTGGWAIGLNSLLLSSSGHTNQKLPSRYFETFIREQLWDKWDNERRGFMLRVSVMDELTSDYCDAMTNGSGSAGMLDELVRENVFISVDNENVYRFHHLFRDFLRNTLQRENEHLSNELYNKSGDWFYEHADYFRAVECYLKCGSSSGVAKSLRFMYNYNSPYASIEDTMAIIHLSVDDHTVNAYPFLLEPLAWTAFVEGRGEDMEGYIDRYFKKLPKVIMQNPTSLKTSVLLRCMDYRSSMPDVAKRLRSMPAINPGRAPTPSLTQNMPFFHRSCRDFASEYAPLDENSFDILRKSVGALIGHEYAVLEYTIRAGIAYERGDMDTAHKFAVEANAAVMDNFAPEIKFCALMLLADVLNAQGHKSDFQKILDKVSDMIEHHKAYYLNTNFQAYLYRLKLSDGDTEAARDWLRLHSASTCDRLAFYKLYQHFTTTRAHIASGDYTAAILFLKKLLALCAQYRRPLDTIEANVLLAIAYWKKGRGTHADAFESLEKALLCAQEYGFTQVFTNDGPELSNMLHRLLKRAIQKDYDGEIPAERLRALHIQTLAQAKHSRGLTGGALQRDVRFTERQKEILTYLSQGLTQKEIGVKLGLKPSTVKSHMILIYNKLDVSNRVDAALKISELKL